MSLWKGQFHSIIKSSIMGEVGVNYPHKIVITFTGKFRHGNTVSLEIVKGYRPGIYRLKGNKNTGIVITTNIETKEIVSGTYESPTDKGKFELKSCKENESTISLRNKHLGIMCLIQ